MIDIMGGGNSGNNISNNTVESNSSMGIDFWRGSSGVVEGNTLKNNHYGIALNASHNLDVYDNIISGNDYGITIMIGSSYNQVFGNLIKENVLGVDIGCSEHYNKVYSNSFIGNDTQAKDYDCDGLNMWDNGYPAGGNYWSDYSGPDEMNGPNQDLSGSDGIIDTRPGRTLLDCVAVDRYPLVAEP